jgi:hypothetical protein
MKKILFLVFVLFGVNGLAQSNIGITRFGSSAPNDTVIGGSSQSYNVWVKNNGPGTFNDALNIVTAVRDSSFSSLDSTDAHYAGVNTILPGDSLLITLTANYNISPMSYRYGIDVIVIWPFASSAITVDSLEFSVFILDPNGTNDLDVIRLLRIYPNPSADKISVDNCSGLSIESIKISDLSGRLMLFNKKQETISIENLKPGIYETDVVLSDKKHYVFKIIKQK